MTSRLLDLKCNDQNKELFHKFPISSFDIIQHNNEIKEKDNNTKISMLSYTNTGFYNKDLRLNGSVIQRGVHAIDEDDSDSLTLNYPILYILLF